MKTVNNEVSCLFQEVPRWPGCILLTLLIAFQLEEKEQLQMICSPVVLLKPSVSLFVVGPQTVNNQNEFYIMTHSVDADISGKPKQCS